MATLKLRIPESARAAVSTLVEQDEAAAKRFREAMVQTGPAESVRQFANRLAAVLGDSVDETRPLARALVGMVATLEHHELSSAEFADSVVAEMEDQQVGAIEYTPERKKLASERLRGYLELPSVVLTAKGMNLRSAYETVWHGCRIFTDMRPIFSADHDPSLLAVLVTHNLAIEVHRDTAEIQTEYFALGSQDIENLKTTVERALKKDHELRKVIKNLEVPLLTSEPNGD